MLDSRGGLDNKQMAHTGAGKGDYVQVTTFKYVGKGHGNVNMNPAPGSHGQGDSECGRNCCLALCLAFAIAVLAWVAMPSSDGAGQLGGLFEVRKASVPTLLPSNTGGIELNIRVKEANYPKLGRDEKALDEFTSAIKYAIAWYVGNDVKKDHVGVAVDQQRELAHAYIVPPCGVNSSLLFTKKMNFTSLGRAIAANLHGHQEWCHHHTAQDVHVSIMGGEEFRADCGAYKEEIAEQLRTLPTTGAPPSTTTMQRRDWLIVTGAQGVSASVINGVYHRQDDLLNDRMVLKKKDDPDGIWMVFELNRWYVTDTERKTDNSGGGWLYSQETDIEFPTDAVFWNSWDGTAWITETQISTQWATPEQEEQIKEPTTAPVVLP